MPFVRRPHSIPSRKFLACPPSAPPSNCNGMIPLERLKACAPLLKTMSPTETLSTAFIRPISGGLAYLRMNDGRMASQKIQKGMDHPAISGRSVTGSLAQLQLGRAQAMAWDQVAARKSCQEFLLYGKKLIRCSDLPTS